MVHGLVQVHSSPVLAGWKWFMILLAFISPCLFSSAIYLAFHSDVALRRLLVEKMQMIDRINSQHDREGNLATRNEQ